MNYVVHMINQDFIKNKPLFLPNQANYSICYRRIQILIEVIGMFIEDNWNFTDKNK